MMTYFVRYLKPLHQDRTGEASQPRKASLKHFRCHCYLWDAGLSGTAFPKEAASWSELSELAICLEELRRFSCSPHKAEQHWPRVYPAVHTSISFTLRGGCSTAFTSGAKDRKDHPEFR